jgi:O-antigen ligase
MSVAELARPAPEPEVSLPARPSRLLHHLGAGLLAALPGALTLYLSFNSGGFYPGASGVAVAVLALVLAGRMVVVRDPFGGFSRPLLVAVAALAAFSAWTLASGSWSHSSSRALVNFNLVNVYLLTLVLFGSSARSVRRVRWTLGLTALAMLAVCMAALAAHLRPDLFPVPLDNAHTRMGWPLTYWNALGEFAVIGLVLATYLTSSTRERAVVRVLAAAATPVFAATIVFTYSRAAVLLGPLAVLLFALLARPRGLPAALAACVPTAGLAVLDSYHAVLVSNGIHSPAAYAQGRHLTTTLVLCCLGAVVIRSALLPLDEIFQRISLDRRTRQRWRLGLVAACLAALVVIGVAFHGPISHQLSNFTKNDSSISSNDVRNRVGNIRIGGRVSGWKAALNMFTDSPVHGQGAGTFEFFAYRQSVPLQAHSLYLQMLGELGVPGFLALAVALAILLTGCFRRARRTSARSLWLALGVVGIIWALHSGVEWDWQMPAVTVPVIALCACALTRRGAAPRVGPGRELGLRVIVGLLALGLALIAVRLSVSDTRLAAAVTAYNADRCPVATQNARASIAANSSRPQPYEIVGFCDIAALHFPTAVGSMQTAVDRDPLNWRYHYDLAIALAAAGRDPRGAIAVARRLDPVHPAVRQAAIWFHSRRKSIWRRAAANLPWGVSLTQ